VKYLLLCCFDEKRWEALPESRRDTIMREYGELIERLDKSGCHLASGQLQPTATATTLRFTNGRLAITDGPYAETKEQLGGYHLIECKDREEALAIAQRIPTLPFGGTVEVRPLT
jgi:hypothetical protein